MEKYQLSTEKIDGESKWSLNRNFDFILFCINFQIIHQPIRWNRQSKIQITHSLTLDIQSKVKYWSEIDLHQFEKKKALFSVRTNLFRHLFFLLLLIKFFQQYHNLKWNDIITDNPYSFISFSQDFEEENSHDQLEEKVIWLLCSFTCTWIRERK